MANKNLYITIFLNCNSFFKETRKKLQKLLISGVQKKTLTHYLIIANLAGQLF